MGGQMMPEQGTWRISTAYDYVNELDAPDLAWEFLRRNPEYRKDYSQLRDKGFGEDKAETALSDKWGLSFRDRSRPPSNARKTRVDTGGRPVDADPTGIPQVDRTCASR